MFQHCDSVTFGRARRRWALLLSVLSVVALALSSPVRADERATPTAALTLVADPAPEKAEARLPAVVLIPGLASDPAVFDAAAERLRAAGLMIWRARIAGFAGASPATDETRANLRHAAARDLLTALAQRAIARAVLVGHSFGGQIAMAAAAEGDPRIAGLVIVDTVPFLAGLFDPHASPESARRQAEAFAAQLAAMEEADAKAVLVRQQTMLTKTAAFRGRLADWTRRSDLATLIAASRQALGDDLRPLLARINGPALILLAHDPAMGMPVELLRGVYESQYAGLPAHRIKVIANSFHFIPVDQPAAFAEAVVDFVRQSAGEQAAGARTPALNAVAQQ